MKEKTPLDRNPISCILQLNSVQMCTTVQSVLAVVAAAVVPLGPGVNVKLKTASGCSPPACSALSPHVAALCRTQRVGAGGGPQPSQTDRTAFVCQGC